MKIKSNSNIFKLANLRLGGRGNTLSIGKNVDIIYGDSPEFGAPRTEVKPSISGENSNQETGLFGRFFGQSNPDLGSDSFNPNNPELQNFNSSNNIRQPRDIRETFKNFKGGEGKFFNPYAVENQTQIQENNPNNSQQKIILEDEET